MRLLTIAATFAIASSTFGQFGGMIDRPMGAGAGYVGQWIGVDVDAINDELGAFGVDDLSSGFYGSGGTGMAYIGALKGLRVGGVFASGGTSSTGAVNNYDREARYEYGFGGLTLEYTLPVSRSVAFSIGATIGYGGSTLEIFSNNGPYNWETEWAQTLGTNASTDNIYRKFECSYWTLAPTLNVDIPLYSLAYLRLGGGYNLALADDDWEADNGVRVKNMPNDINNDAYYIQAGLIVGFFLF